MRECDFKVKEIICWPRCQFCVVGHLEKSRIRSFTHKSKRLEQEPKAWRLECLSFQLVPFHSCNRSCSLLQPPCPRKLVTLSKEILNAHQEKSLLDNWINITFRGTLRFRLNILCGEISLQITLTQDLAHSPDHRFGSGITPLSVFWSSFASQSELLLWYEKGIVAFFGNVCKW